MSNVAMKVNAKLGGVTCRAVSKNPEANIRPYSMFIGADVSHASPGSLAPSLSAISVSADKIGAKYMGRCETGHRRVEIIDNQNMKEMLVPLVDQWTKTVGQGNRPKNVYYFRDGVSTGQFAQVLEQEVPIIKDVIFHGSGDKEPPKVTVVIANKRHHLRAVPAKTDKQAGDKNGNPLPGTLIERDITSPHGWDFLLISHVALQGTSQPVHYHVIRDEIGHTPVQLQNMIYNHCYQYVRSTTSVSLCKHPPLLTLQKFQADPLQFPQSTMHT
jgi:eukaryotic translation initiation factor 2C